MDQKQGYYDIMSVVKREMGYLTRQEEKQYGRKSPVTLEQVKTEVKRRQARASTAQIRKPKNETVKPTLLQKRKMEQIDERKRRTAPATKLNAVFKEVENAQMQKVNQAREMEPQKIKAVFRKNVPAPAPAPAPKPVPRPIPAAPAPVPKPMPRPIPAAPAKAPALKFKPKPSAAAAPTPKAPKVKTSHVSLTDNMKAKPIVRSEPAGIDPPKHRQPKNWKMTQGDANFELRNTYNGKKITIKNGNLSMSGFKLNNIQGYWPWGYWEGNVADDHGECLLVLTEDNKYYIIKSQSKPIIREIDVDGPVIGAAYAVASGDDGGSVYIVTKNTIYAPDFDDDDKYLAMKRDTDYERTNSLSMNDAKHLVEAYLGAHRISNRGFGYVWDVDDDELFDNFDYITSVLYKGFRQELETRNDINRNYNKRNPSQPYKIMTDLQMLQITDTLLKHVTEEDVQRIQKERKLPEGDFYREIIADSEAGRKLDRDFPLYDEDEAEAAPTAKAGSCFEYQLFDISKEEFYDDIEEVVKSVKFDVSRFGKFTHTIKFSEPVTVFTAVLAAEKFLSEPLTKEWYEKVQSDLFYNETPWEKAKTEYKCRGDLLTDAVWMEGIDVNEANGMLTFRIGS